MSEEIVAHYKQLSETTGESLESIAVRVESMDSPHLAAQLREAAGTTKADAPKKRGAAPKETAEAMPADATAEADPTVEQA
jgi:hypothetical protein